MVLAGLGLGLDALEGVDAVIVARLRRSIFVAAGVLVATGCTSRAVGPDDLGDDGATSAEEGDDGDGDGATAGDDGPGSEGEGDGEDGDPTATADDGPVELCPDEDDSFGVVRVCMPDGDSCGSCSGECAAKAGEVAESQGAFACGGWEDTAVVMCSTVVAGECCQLVQIWDLGCAGRPLVVEGRSHVADLAPRHDWLAGIGPSREGELDFATRCELAGRWREMAQAEHASVASFARFGLDLLGLGAPPALLSATSRAMADEVEHARLCFAMASGYDGHALGPAELPAATVVAPGRDAAAIVAAAVVEGCIEETISAALAGVAAARAEDPAVARVLRKIARDEERHAALAWSFVRWIAKERPELLPALESAFEAAMRDRAAPNGAPESDLSAHGMLGTHARRSIARATLRDVIAPARAGLLTAVRAA